MIGENMSKKFGFVYLVCISFFMSVVLGLVVPAINTGSVTLTSFAFIFGLSLVGTIVLGLILPLPKLTAWFCQSLAQNPNTGLGKIFANFFSTTLMMLIMTFVMVGLLTGVGEGDGTNYMGRYVTGFLHILPVLVTSVIFLEPLAMSIAKAIVKEEQIEKSTDNTQQQEA
jgi:hypothetical protein